MLQTYISYAAVTLQPWVWPAAGVAAASFLLFLALRRWACGPGFRLVKSTRASTVGDDGPHASHRFGSALLRGFVWSVAFGSTLLRRLSMACALVAVAGFAAVSLASPAQAGAGQATLTQAQQALKGVVPTEYARVSNLAAPEVTMKDGSTTFTFRVPGTSGGKSGKSTKARTYLVTIGPSGAEVRQAP